VGVCDRMMEEGWDEWGSWRLFRDSVLRLAKHLQFFSFFSSLTFFQYTPSVLNYKSFWFFFYPFSMYLDII
jgi:hypothetical protein